MIDKINFLPTIVFKLNNGNVTTETAGLREGDKEFAPADRWRRVTGTGGSREPHAAAGRGTQPDKVRTAKGKARQTLSKDVQDPPFRA